MGESLTAELLLVDDHPLFREGFAHMLRSFRPAWLLRFAGTTEEALLAIGHRTPDLAIVDVTLPGHDGFALLQALREHQPSLPAIMISGREDIAVRVRARASGAKGFLAKTATPEAMTAAIDTMLRGGEAFDSATLTQAPALTPRQAEVLMLLTEGHGNKEIRYRLGIAERTVRAHMTDLFELLGVHSRTQAIIRARELGLI